jgi:drug/metabolite transporter (DMT)-like permease
MKKYTCDERPYLLSGYQFVLGGAVMTVCGLAMGGTLSVSNVKCIIVIVYLALVSAIGYSLWSILLKYNDVSKVTICGFMTPIFGFLLCVLIFRNDVDNLLYNLIGLVLVVIGIVFVNSKDKRLSKS